MLHTGKRGGIVPRDITKNSKGSNKDLVGKARDGAFEMETSKGTVQYSKCRECETKWELSFPVGAYGEISYGLGTDKIDYELGKYSVPGGAEFSNDFTYEHEWGSKAFGFRVAVYGKGALEGTYVVK